MRSGAAVGLLASRTGVASTRTGDGSRTLVQNRLIAQTALSNDTMTSTAPAAILVQGEFMLHQPSRIVRGVLFRSIAVGEWRNPNAQFRTFFKPAFPNWKLWIRRCDEIRRPRTAPRSRRQETFISCA